MNNKKLNVKSNLHGAMVFLNTFGLILEEGKSISDSDILYIFDVNNNLMGNLIIKNDEFIIDTKTVYGNLSASYSKATITSFTDYESLGNPRFAQWSNDINFCITNEKNKKIMDGTFNIKVSLDEAFGSKVLCHPTFKYYASDNSTLDVKFQADGKVFYMNYNKDEVNEEIELTPYYDRYFLHKITNGNYDKEIHCWPYIKMNVLRNDGTEDHGDLQTLFIEEKYDKIIESQFNNYKRVASEYEKEKFNDLLNQKAELVKKIGKEAHNKISKLIKEFNVQGNSLIDNFIAVSLVSYSDFQIRGFFGVERKPLTYQNGATTLQEAYFDFNDPLKMLSETNNGISFVKDKK